MKIYTNQRILIICSIICGFFLFTVLSQAQEPYNLRTEELLKSVAIAHVDNQLSESADLASYEDVEYVNQFADCRTRVRSRIDLWVANLNLAPSSQQQHRSRIRVVVPINLPVNGDIIITYRIYTDTKKAFLEILFHANRRLSFSERQVLVSEYDLIELKKELISDMKCSVNQ